MPDQTFFYFPVSTSVGEEFLVDTEEYNHIVKSVRKTIGDPVDFVDGNGKIIHATITGIHKKTLHCQTRSVERSTNELPVLVCAAIALIKQQRFEWMAEKLTELGVSRIQPLVTERVVRSGFRQDRIQKKVIAAMKQSERAVLPEIENPVTFTQWLQNIDPQNTFIAAQSAKQYRLNDYGESLRNEITFAIGPEGGWSEDELHQMQEQSIHPFHLGNRRLRTETAAIAALTEIASIIENNPTSRRAM